VDIKSQDEDQDTEKQSEDCLKARHCVETQQVLFIAYLMQNA